MRTAPTKYTVTFRYYDPTATTVQVRGEWFFSIQVPVRSR